jgi:protein-arginine kinase activator protein McsA
MAIMSDMKCPFCNQELRKISATSFFVCDSCNITGFDKLWQELIHTHKDLSDKIGKLETDLERTRKALDVAVDAIDEILYLDSGKFIQEPAEMWKIAKSAKDKITALEQKE